MKMKLVNLRIFLTLSVITGCIYPLVITGIGLAFFPEKARGSLMRDEEGKIIGSELIAQPFQSNKYFWPRPSAGDYGTMPSGASNLSWTSRTLLETVEERRQQLLKSHGAPDGSDVPADLLFASGSGLESYITPEAAYFQAKRVARQRGLQHRQMMDLIRRHLIPGGILGNDVINIMTLNAELDRLP